MLYNVLISMGSFSMRFEAITADDVAKIMDVLDWEPKVFFGGDPGTLNVQIVGVPG